MQHKWLYLHNGDVETERRQCREEGRDISSLDAEFERLLSADLSNDAGQKAVQSLLDQTIALPVDAALAAREPSDLAGIRAARPASRRELPALRAAAATLLDKAHGAWTGRCVGCLLGKPVEGLRRRTMWPYLKSNGLWPLNDYFRGDELGLNEWKSRSLADRVDYSPADDDTNYTTSALAIFKRHGRDFTPGDVANFWLREMPLLVTCTAERVACRNFALNIAPPDSATFRNPYREWIGAQIRADFWGYVCPGNPELAAEFAWRDASISHVKNGIYGTMWVAAMTAAAFVSDDIETVITAGLDQIPAHCRLSQSIETVLEWQRAGVEYDEAVEKLHALWNEEIPHDWTHTISNAMVVAIGLLWGEKDFARTICRAVQPCFDTDCNGATTGSIVGAMLGRQALPSHWAEHINDTLHTGVAGYAQVKLSDMARETVALMER